MGDPLDKNTDVGAINNAAQLAKIEELVEAGLAEGADMYQPACDLPARGWFFRPTLFTNVAQSSRIAQEEIFGPVLSVLTFRTPAEAIEKANNTAYGLTAGVWTEKGSRILKMVSKLRAGVVWANTFNRFDPTSPVRWLQGIGLRPRGWPAWPAGVPRPRRRPLMPTLDSRYASTDGGTPAPHANRTVRLPHPAPGARIAGAQDVQALRRAASSRAPSRAARTSSAAPTATPLANAVRSSRKDLRDAVRAARGAFAGWSGKTAMNRGQVLYRVAELMEGRRVAVRRRGGRRRRARARGRRDAVDRSIDRWVWYAGWADKISQVLGTVNPVAAPYFNFTIPEPTGVVGVVAPDASSLLGLVSRVAPAVVGGNAVVVLASESRPLPAVTLGEVLATSDVPPGVINILTGLRASWCPSWPAHMDVNAIDTWGVPREMRAAVEEAAIESVKRLSRPPRDRDERFDWLDDRRAQRPEWIASFLEMKTVWHPIGM